MALQTTSLSNDNRSCRAQSGFTLLEILVTIAIVGILASLALPNVGAFIDKEKIKAISNEFSSSLVNARSAAIKSGMHVVMCASSTGAACSADWSAGWYAFRDDDKDGEQGTGEVTLLVYTATSDNVDVSVANAGTSVNSVRFDYRGTPDTLLEADFSRNQASRRVQLTAFGKSRIQ